MYVSIYARERQPASASAPETRRITRVGGSTPTHTRIEIDIDLDIDR